MGYYSEQHLIYGSAASRAATTLPGRAEPQDGDGGRIVFQRRLGDEPQYRYFADSNEARRAAKALRPQWIAVVQTRHADGYWI